jgi:hypothetical protein
MGAARELDDAGRSAATTSTVAFVAGGAAVALGAVLFFTAPSARSKTSVALVPTGQGALLEGHF